MPHIGWNDLHVTQQNNLLMAPVGGRRVYFVHSYRATPSEANRDWVLATSGYGSEFVAAVNKGHVAACQFHPEKSGATGLAILRAFLEPESAEAQAEREAARSYRAAGKGGLARRVIACLDVRANDRGDLVVTKGDQYDVRERGEGESEVR